MAGGLLVSSYVGHSLDVEFFSVIQEGIFVPEREEKVGGWRRLHNEELHNLYASTNIIRVIK
jgi:hypothetical protein